MKQTILILIILLTITVQSEAQDKKGYISLSLGPSFPIGDFSSKDIDNGKAGFAATGGLLEISFAYKLGEGNFGITALLRDQVNLFDNQSFVNEFTSKFPTTYWTVEGDGWGMGAFLFGGYGSFPFAKKASFDTRLMLGVSVATSPEITITETEKGKTTWLNQSSASTSAFTYLIGAGFKYEIGKRLCLLTNLDYLGAKPEFSSVQYLSSDGSMEWNTFSQKIGTINLSAGIALKM